MQNILGCNCLGWGERRARGRERGETESSGRREARERGEAEREIFY